MSELFPVRLSDETRVERMQEGNRLVDVARRDPKFDATSLSFLLRDNVPMISNALLSGSEQIFNNGKDMFSSGATGRLGGAENKRLEQNLFTGFGEGTLREQRDRMRQARIDALIRKIQGNQ